MIFFFFFCLRIRRPPRSPLSSSSAASDVYKRQREGCIMRDDTDVDFCITQESPLRDPAFREDLERLGYLPHPDESSLDPEEVQYQYIYKGDYDWLAESGLGSLVSRMQHSLFKPLNIDLYDSQIWTDPIEFGDGHVVVLGWDQMRPNPHRMAVEGQMYAYPRDSFGVLDSKFPGWRAKRIHFAVLACMIGKWLPVVLGLAYVLACWNVQHWRLHQGSLTLRISTYLSAATMLFLFYVMLRCHFADAYKFRTIILRQSGQP
eukprot:TRINITY_DN29419_c0_g1_i1.p1 TRINITY_DN29419_c0_g1~~TRINITY_DN29419_c0_g1_i1.p1  ORF type:complete len:261 (+),score=52.74 TRINITY_DN29419_c0_g1_i1:46-828(+)